MLPTINGHYDGKHIVMDEDLPLKEGQQVIITVLGEISTISKPKKIDFSKYMNRGPKMFEGDAQDWIRELRANDRL